MKSAVNRKVENQTMEDILSSIRKIIADDQKNAAVDSEKPTVQTTPISASIPDESIDGDILALRAALNAIRGEMDGIQSSMSIIQNDAPELDSSALDAGEVLGKRDDATDEKALEGLVSVKSEQSIRQAFANLSNAAHQQIDMESTVRSVLRPLLQQWLDHHLPQLVEKLVKEEIARLSGRAE